MTTNTIHLWTTKVVKIEDDTVRVEIVEASGYQERRDKIIEALGKWELKWVERRVA